MDIFRIRLKNHPDLFVGKRSSSYALIPDQRILRRKSDINPSCFWFVKEKYAKVWTDKTVLKQFLTYCKDNKTDTFSQYELLNGDNVVIEFNSL